jgi:Lipocalin-like domain
MMTNLRSVIVGLALAVLISVGMAGTSAAQSAKEVEGTWQLAAVVVVEGEKKTDLFGRDPKGQMVLGADGRFTIVVTRSDLPKFKSGSRVKGTADEFQATVQGSVAYWGTYTVEGGNLVFKVAGATFPNWIGETQQRAVKIVGDELGYSTPPTKTGAVSTLSWKRAK